MGLRRDGSAAILDDGARAVCWEEKMKTTSTTYELADGLSVTMYEDHDGVALVNATYESSESPGDSGSLLKGVPIQVIERIARLSGTLRGSGRSVCVDHGYFDDKSKYSYRCPECDAEEKAQKRLELEAKANSKEEVSTAF